MNPKKHPSNNRTICPPSDWDDRGGKLQIPAMHATQGKIYGVDVFVSWWKPSEDELMCLLRGGSVQLTCLGGQPPVNLSAVDENGSHNGIILPN
jgi:hypothetical protein